MPPEPETLRGVLYLIVCGAPPARDANRLVQLAQAEGWDVCVIATPSGRSFIDSPALEAATGHPIRSEYKQPDAADVLPPPDAIVVAPATFNTINKWAAGISDTLALGLLTEAIGKRLPVVALPFINAAQAEHPAFQASVDRLVSMGATVHEKPVERGPGFVTASVVDPFGNILGVMYNRHYLEVFGSQAARGLA